MHTFFIAPTDFGIGITSISLGMVRALERAGLKVGFFKPIAQTHPDDPRPDPSTELIARNHNIIPPKPIPLAHVEQMLSDDMLNELMEEIISLYQQVRTEYEVVVVEGMVSTRYSNYTARINASLVKSMDAEVVLVSAPSGESMTELCDRIEIHCQLFGGPRAANVIGVVFNKIRDEDDPETFVQRMSQAANLVRDDFRILGCIPWHDELNAPRVMDVAEQLGARIINAGEYETRRVNNVVLSAAAAPHILSYMKAGTLLVTSGDRADILLAAGLAAMNGTPLAGLILCSDIEPDSRVMEFCQSAMKSGLPILGVKTMAYETVATLQEMDREIPADDKYRAELVTEFVAGHLDVDWLHAHCGISRELRLSPPAFRYSLVQSAKAAAKKIVLPEGDEPRTIQAAVSCHHRQIATCILLAKPDEVHHIAQTHGIELPADLQILDPDLIRSRYVTPMVELRKNKGINELMAEKQLEDNVMLGTMMLALDEVDGLVSGAMHTTANTVRPALQLIKTAPGYNLVSSIFFMLLPEQVVVYGDCAINPDPSAEELADIAIQSADSATAFGIAPRVAMISYSTGNSGSGQDVDKVREAARLAKEKRPDLLIDGPLQYDAAAIESVGRQKAPGSPVAGKATVFIFPDLNTGNTTYKAVQRSANVVSVGPMLQGLRKPVNDLSRGALVDDIIFTIALTAIQAKAAEIKNLQS